MPEETLDLTKIHVDEYPKIGEITKIISDYLNSPDADNEYIRRLLAHENERFVLLVPTYERYNKNMTPEMAKLYRALISAQNDNSMDANAFINAMQFVSSTMGYNAETFNDTHAGILIKMIKDKKIDENFAHMALSRAVKQYAKDSYGTTTFIVNEQMGAKLLKTLADMPQATIKDMDFYARSLKNWEEVLKVENDAKQKLDAQLKAQFENVDFPDIKKTRDILDQRNYIKSMVEYAKKIAPDDKKATVEAEAQEVLKKYRNDNWLDGNNFDNGYQTKYDQDATKRVVEAEEKASNAEKQIKEKDDEIARLMEQIKKLEAEKEKLSSDLSEQKRKTQDERDINNRLEKENEQLKTTNASLQQQNDIMRGTVATFVKQAERDFENDSRLTRGVNLMDKVKKMGQDFAK